MSTVTNPHQLSSTSEMAVTGRQGQLSQPALLTLCVLTNNIGVYSKPPQHIADFTTALAAFTPGPPTDPAGLVPSAPDLPDPSTTPGVFTHLLIGSLDDICRYSRQENAQWLLDIAHDICDPALKRGSLLQWNLMQKAWQSVNPTDPLMASRYCYSTQPGIQLALTKISKRENKSKSSPINSAITMASNVSKRDGNRCWISNVTLPLKNSHICPKRMGDSIFQVIYGDFVSNPPPNSLSVLDAVCGITLSPTLDVWFNAYELGMRFVSPDEYECHLFPSLDSGTEGYEHTISGPTQGTLISAPVLHGFRVHPPNPGHTDNPPPGLFRWHYLQCVIKKFAHPDYPALQNIFYPELPLKMEGDSDDEGTDSDFEWPTAILDHGRAMQAEIKERIDEQNRVAEWVSKVYTS